MMILDSGLLFWATLYTFVQANRTLLSFGKPVIG